jgi:uncharacterized membrane-anchored protein YhcB (DUF1043 family)
MTNLERISIIAFAIGMVAYTAINYFTHRVTRRLLERKLEELRAEFDDKLREILKKQSR